MLESESTVTNTLMLGMEWLSYLVYLNLLWLLGVVAGGVIFGIAPATLSLCAVLRERIWNQQSIKVAPFFLKKYQQIWKESNRFIFPLYSIYFFLWIDFWATLQLIPSITILFIIFTLIVFLSTCYFFLFYEIFNGLIFTKFNNSLLLLWLFPTQSLGIIVTTIGSLLLINQFPALSILFSVSLPFSLFHYILKNKYRRNFHNLK